MNCSSPARVKFLCRAALSTTFNELRLSCVRNRNETTLSQVNTATSFSNFTECCGSIQLSDAGFPGIRKG
jgi:hypothetical protein